jgi:hypothetical protein
MLPIRCSDKELEVVQPLQIYELTSCFEKAKNKTYTTYH